VTLIAGICCREGLILIADTEEVLEGALKTYSEKMYYLSSAMGNWQAVIAGAGDVDYILMARDLIKEKLESTRGNDADIIEAIRDSIHEMWRDHANFEAEKVQLRLLIGSFSSDSVFRFTVVSGAAVRAGREIEAMGMGDAIFLGMADRFIPRGGLLGYVSGEAEALRLFAIYAAQAAKATPGVGGMTRIVTISRTGNFRWEKSFKVVEVQEFFGSIHASIRSIFNNFTGNPIAPEDFIKLFSKKTIREIGQLRKELERIEKDPSLI
jgi:hypothetical protein